MCWRCRPAQQRLGTCIQAPRKLLFVIDGKVTVEIEGQAQMVLGAGEIILIPAEVPHLARNDGSGAARALVTHSRAEKEKPSRDGRYPSTSA